ncbi:MAG TPA: DinB family protein [Acidimicrobiales bacterium]|jgi:uncharacterized damage-inducible protein DinB|nr:DinB family protein [Acidimicrobiales bacterium]
MPGQVPPVKDERDALLSYLRQMRLVMRLTAYGLTDEQARATPTVSTLSVGGLIKHVATVEQGWIDMVQQRGGAGTDDDYETNFRMIDDETLGSVLARYDDVAAETERVIASVDLDDPVPVPKGVPWFPDDVDAWSVRWVLLHVIQETARHTGHADIVRESVDGATAFPLMAAAEGWPATPWMTPWAPPSRDEESSSTMDP